MTMIHSDPTPRERRREQNRRRILDTASALVTDGGLDALTINGLARALDYTPGALYRYFPSRDALVVALQLEVLEEWGARVARVRQRCADAPVAGATAVLLAPLAMGALYRALSVAEPAWYALVTAMLADPRRIVADDVAAPAVAPMLALVGQVADTLRAAEGVALVPGDAGARAIQLVSALQGVLQLRKLERLTPGLDADRLARDLTRTLLLGWGAALQALGEAEAALADLVRDEPLVEPDP